MKYVLYGNRCGKKHRMQRIGATAKNSVTVKKAGGKKLKKGTYYKFVVVALDADDNVVSTSKVVHVATKGGKAANPAKVTVKKKVLKKAKSLTVGKKLKLAAAQASPKSGKVKKHAAIRYESSDPQVATVSKKGVVKGVSAGSATVYCYAQNGAVKAVKVKVKAKAGASVEAQAQAAGDSPAKLQAASVG